MKISRITATTVFERDYIRRGGKILPGGIIQVLSEGVDDAVKGDPFYNNAGLCLFSHKLARYGTNPNLFAVLDKRQQIVKVINRKERKVVRRIPFCDFVIVEVSTATVDVDGWLACDGMVGLRFSSGPLFHGESLTESLRMAESGKKPTILDGSTFVRVSANRIGQRVIEVELSDSLAKNPRFAVFTINMGKPVKCKASRPIAHEKWR